MYPEEEYSEPCGGYGLEAAREGGAGRADLDDAEEEEEYGDHGREEDDDADRQPAAGCEWGCEGAGGEGDEGVGQGSEGGDPAGCEEWVDGAEDDAAIDDVEGVDESGAERGGDPEGVDRTAAPRREGGSAHAEEDHGDFERSESFPVDERAQEYDQRREGVEEEGGQVGGDEADGGEEERRLQGVAHASEEGELGELAE